MGRRAARAENGGGGAACEATLNRKALESREIGPRIFMRRRYRHHRVASRRHANYSRIKNHAFMHQPDIIGGGEISILCHKFCAAAP